MIKLTIKNHPFITVCILCIIALIVCMIFTTGCSFTFASIGGRYINSRDNVEARMDAPSETSDILRGNTVPLSLSPDVPGMPPQVSPSPAIPAPPPAEEEAPAESDLPNTENMPSGVTDVSIGDGFDHFIVGFLWKPISERGSLACLLPGHIPGPADGKNPHVSRVYVQAPGLNLPGSDPLGGTVMEDLKYHSKSNPVGGRERTTWRARRPGGQYPSPCYLVAEWSNKDRFYYNISHSEKRNAGPGSPNRQVEIDTVTLALL